MLNWMEKRTGDFSRNSDLESLLGELNPVIEIAEDNLLAQSIKTKLPPNLFVVGCPRAGTTMLMQTLATTGQFCYPTNFLSRFFAGLGFGSKMQKMLFEEQYQFRNELGLSKIVEQELGYQSDLGKTTGPLSPHVFWYFWYKHFMFGDTTYLTDSQWLNSNIERFIKECHLFTHEWQKPSVMKGMIMNWNLTDFANSFESSLFVRIKRNKYSLANSILKARLAYSGSIDNWWSFKPPEFEQIHKYPPRVQVAAFILSNEKALDYADNNIDNSRFITINYEDLCHQSEQELDKLEAMFKALNCELNLSKVSDGIILNKEITEQEIQEWEVNFNIAEQEIKYLY